jgi:hypothetical protein
MALALDIDQIKHSLGGWEDDATASGLHARRLALVMAGEQLRSGNDVFVGQYLVRTDFIESLEDLADRRAASFHEFVLQVDAERLARRLDRRAQSPSRPEHVVNSRIVGPADAPALVRSLTDLRTSRPGATWVDANGTLDETVASISAAIT